ncbi:MAG TPA: AraC family transcriptional regulator [Flavipsychrobacter sp.]|nr:AraC family transcriptional regulator [Flavipsychrobacter sp.]
MQHVKTADNIRFATLSNLVGQDVEVVSTEPVFINNFVHAAFVKLHLSSPASFGEEGGRLHLYPVDEGQFHLHLLYIAPDQDMTAPEVCWLQFKPSFFHMFEEKVLMTNTPFRFDKTTEQQFNVCAPSRILLEQLRDITALTPLLQSLQLTEIALQLLRRAIENITIPFSVCPVPACRFLANDSERDKIVEARAILESTIDQPLTIKELSRKVAMNECYLKKGFKTITGKTINEYQQHLRISKAKELLQQKGQTVSEVASVLGYSSISHFSTAFKKATGLKPCELLG